MLYRANGKGSMLLASLAVLSVSFSAVPKGGRGLQRDDEKVCYYVINNRTDSVLRVVDILIDEEAFTEPKLRRLMDQFREKYDEPNMWVILYSKLDQFNHSQLGDIVVQGPPKPRDRYAGGILIYRGVDQVIRYKTAGSELHTVVVKGVDPAGRK